MVFFSGSHFRSARVGAALTVFALLLLVFRHPLSGRRVGANRTGAPSDAGSVVPARGPNLLRVGLFGAMTSIGLSAGLFDKQGAFLVVILALVSSVMLVLGGDSRDPLFPAAMSAATILYFGWSRFLSPALTEAIVRTLRESWESLSGRYRLDASRFAGLEKRPAVADILARVGGGPIPPSLDPRDCCPDPDAPKKRIRGRRTLAK